MPRYTYVCASCGRDKEVVHTIAQCWEHNERCPYCLCSMKRAIETPAIKGKGIYPFTLGNQSLDESVDGFRELGKMTPNGLVIENKEQHKEVMAAHKCVTPYLDGSKCADYNVKQGR